VTPIERQLAPPDGWHAATAHLPPLALAQLSLPLRTLFAVAARWAKKRTGTALVPDVFLLLLRHPRLFWPWLRFASKLMPYGTLDRRDAELMILRVAWNCRCRYEWGQHVPIALLAGVPAADITRLAHGPAADGWRAHQAALLQAVDELHRHKAIADATWQRLREHFDERRLIEITMLIGHYEMLAGVLNSAGLPLETATEAQLADAPIHG
jgi:alkylhydroperoxidase family enzyme